MQQNITNLFFGISGKYSEQLFITTNFSRQMHLNILWNSWNILEQLVASLALF